MVLILLLLLFTTVAPGCVRRRMTVRTDPPGATVYVDDQEIGTSPASSKFVYYGTRKIQVVRDGYETQTVLEKVATPWYQVPPIDFFSEHLWPFEIRDERIVNIQMHPQRVVPTEELLSRATDLRQEANTSPVRQTPPGTYAPSVTAEPSPMATEPASDNRLPPPFFPQ